jgi:hypothetical protein
METVKILSSVLSLDPTARADVRREADAVGSTCPVEVVEGDDAPELVGSSGYHTTPSGLTIVRHPGAYRWPTVYHHSTRRVEVGVDWLIEHGYLACYLAQQQTSVAA